MPAASIYPWLTQPPSRYVREHVRLTTQPMEEPDEPEHLLQLLDMIGGEELLMFATDYPHWDFDAPDRALPAGVTGVRRERILALNAVELYGLA